jgi:hypothetical protein
MFASSQRLDFDKLREQPKGKVRECARMGGQPSHDAAARQEYTYAKPDNRAGGAWGTIPDRTACE